MILAPDPSDPRTQYVPLRSGFQPYSEIRDRYIDQFTHSSKGPRSNSSGRASPKQQRRCPWGPRKALSQPPAKAPAAGAAPVSPEGLLKDVIGQIRRNRLENIMLLVPPDGFDLDLTQSLRDLSAQVIGPTDVRFDIVLVGSSKVPKSFATWRHVPAGSSSRSRTSTRSAHWPSALRNEQASGAWVTIPRQGSILFPNLENQSLSLPRKRRRTSSKHDSTRTSSSINPSLKMCPKTGQTNRAHHVHRATRENSRPGHR